MKNKTLVSITKVNVPSGRKWYIYQGLLNGIPVIGYGATRAEAIDDATKDYYVVSKLAII